MSGIGIDPGTALLAVSRCSVDAQGDDFEFIGGQAEGILPSIVLADGLLEPILEHTQPALPYGVGGEWPPEAVADPARGARRLPLSLALSVLADSTDVPHSSANRQWAWTTAVNTFNQQRHREAMTTLIRRTMQGVSRREVGPVALAVGNDLPLVEQTGIVSHAGTQVRLIWRCMAAGLAWMDVGGSAGHAEKVAQPKEGAQVLHVHLGLDGFEATKFHYKRSKGKAGPELLVPARSRPNSSNTVSRPFLGLQLCARGNAKSGRSMDAVWSRLFCDRDPTIESLNAGEIVVGHSGDSKDVRLGWPRVFQATKWSQEQTRQHVFDFVGAVEKLISGSKAPIVNRAILTGDFFHSVHGTVSGQLRTAPADGIRSLLKKYSIETWIAPPGSIARGAASFASRRARGWATFLDELPSVEIVAQFSEGPAWKKLLEAKHYDAGVPVCVQLDQFWLNAGEKHIELAVYVDEHGPDEPDVLKTRVDFPRSTQKQTPAKVTVEIEAASGLPVVRADLLGDLDESAEVDWAKDYDACHTGLRKIEYLATLPRAFPPIQERESGFWWTAGGKFKTAKVAGVEYTGEELGERLVKLFPGSELKFAPVLAGYQRLAAKREWNENISKWVAPTDSEGVNTESDSIGPALETLYKCVGKTWEKPSLRNTAGRAIAALGWRDPKWIDHLMKRCDDVDVCGELDYAIAGLGGSIYCEPHMSRAIAAMASRLHDKVYIAKAKAKQPVGIHTLRALGVLFSTRPDALKYVRAPVANQLAEDITLFIEQTLEHGKFMQKFQAALNALVFLTRRRAYQDGFLPVGSPAFNRAVQCCAKVYVAARLSQCGPLIAPLRAKLIIGFKEDLKALQVGGKPSKTQAHEETRHVIDALDLTKTHLDGQKFPNDPTKLLVLLVKVIEYIEGRGSGLLVIDDDGEDVDDE